MRARPPSTGTRTFFFCDLRGYTKFVEERGDDEAADLIRAYRQLVRKRVDSWRGAEVKTEGDSFFVVFSTARDALDCAMGILHDAERQASTNPLLPIAVGAGLHAGDTVAEDRGYVGSAVNIAARLAQNANAGELLVSDTVRGLLRTSGLPPLIERTDIALKGVSEAPRIWSVDWRSAPVPPTRPSRPRRRIGRRALFAAGTAVLPILGLGVAAARALDLGSSASTPPRVPGAGLPPHGASLFQLDTTPLGGRQIRTSFGDRNRDAVRFVSDAIEITASAGSSVTLTILDLAPDDLVAELAASTLSGDGTFALWFRGSEARQIQSQVTPRTGEVVVQVTRPLDPSGPPERLFGPASRLPRGADQRIAVSARGPDVVIYRDAAEVARGRDPRPVGGAMGFVVSAAKDREHVVRLTTLRVFAP